jgi:hypothetical protein
VKNEPRTCPIQFVRTKGEETDAAVYELRDDSVYPAGKTFVMKDGGHAVQYLSESKPASDVPEPNFDEITKITGLDG